MAEKQQPVVISLDDLTSGSVTLLTLSQAFGPSSLGILIVSDLPSTFLPLRLKLLSFASQLAHLSSSELERLTDPSSHYNVGWSHGKEALKPGKYDTMKGSFYVSVVSSYLQNTPSTLSADLGNLWPKSELLPGFREAFEALCTMIIDIGILVARLCDRFARENVEEFATEGLEHIIRKSITHKARLLHYFPQANTPTWNPQISEEDDWCALHLDDGCLTGLTSALFVDEASNEFQPIASPDPKSGLYIQSRIGEVVKVNIPADCLAFQTGQALEIMTKGKLLAVPHFVRGPSVRNQDELAGQDNKIMTARNTLAVFMQPGIDEILDERSGITFGQHIRLSDEKHA